ncbi:hypothetical protein ANCDUO_03580 [Ancylostoma duodenale]|uniref:Uncharacterized protein n=1 Tax=Ancylostoma duodenale TaxID=51022 RepID=A0A0C2DTF2_9BILA|nr:hypothetical protein ANCDUO_03580 [Ancylostoma duodenale]
MPFMSVSYIKQDANRAYEKQARYQEDIFLRTKRRIVRFRTAVRNVRRESTAIEGRPAYSEEKRAISDDIPQLIDPDAQKTNPNSFKSIGDVKRYYGDQVDAALKKLQEIEEMVEKMWGLFTPSTYEGAVLDGVVRMDRIVELMAQLSSGN